METSDSGGQADSSYDTGASNDSAWKIPDTSDDSAAPSGVTLPPNFGKPPSELAQQTQRLANTIFSSSVVAMFRTMANPPAPKPPNADQLPDWYLVSPLSCLDICETLVHCSSLEAPVKRCIGKV